MFLPAAGGVAVRATTERAFASATSLKPVPHFINSRLAGITAEKCRPKLTTLANSFYACRRRKRTNSSPNGKPAKHGAKKGPANEARQDEERQGRAGVELEAVGIKGKVGGMVERLANE